jgi:hypothetical protein
MFKIFYAEKDTSLYELYNESNTGLDEILEIGKNTAQGSNTLTRIRSIVKFDQNEISQSLAKYNKTVNDCKFIFNLYTCQAQYLATEYSVNVKILGQNWINGTGYASSLTTDGATWEGPESGSSWISGSQLQKIGSSNLYISGSGAGGNFLYYSGSGVAPSLISSESFSYRNSDINIDVTNAIKIWISGSEGHTIPNYGFLIQMSDSDENNNNVTGCIKYFSRDTHTIYVPRLTMYFDNSTYVTGSLTAVNLDSYLVYTKIKPEYQENEVAKIRIYSRNKYPLKSATNLFPIETVNYLPTSSYYSIIDAVTNETIVQYDDIYTKLSCDSTSNFIHLDMSGLMPERSYMLKLKIVDGFTTQHIEDKVNFKIVR